jgi:uncharacterized protein
VEIRDPVHGSIHIQNEDISIISHPAFQRLRNIKQLGFSEFAFPGATHTRYIHSIGVMHVANIQFDKIFKNFTPSKELMRLKQTLKLACLLHDIGHAPLSHSTEMVMPKLAALNLPARYLKGEDLQRQATHEDYTIKTISDSDFTTSFKHQIQQFGVDPNAVAELVTGICSDEGYFTINGISFFPILHQMVSSEVDCDRMDYLLRDSYFCGVSYGQYDLDWLTDNMVACERDKKLFLGINERAVSTFDDFLLSRFHMFLMVYFHYRAVCLEQMLLRYFISAPNEYVIPGNIDEYIEHDDHYLSKHLRMSKNKWAQMIVQNKIPAKILECFGDNDRENLEELELYLNVNSIDYIKCSSRGRLSKYYTADKMPSSFPILVDRNKRASDPKRYIDIHQATELFEKYSGSHSVVRIHCDLSELSANHVKHINNLIQ